MPYLARHLLQDWVVPEWADGSHAKGVELLLELLVDGGERKCFRVERTTPREQVLMLFVFGISQRHQVVFIPVRSADVLWRTVAFAGDAAWIRDIRIRLQNGLQQQVMLPVITKVVHILELSPHALYNVMDPCSLHIHDFALVVHGACQRL